MAAYLVAMMAEGWVAMWDMLTVVGMVDRLAGSSVALLAENWAA